MRYSFVHWAALLTVVRNSPCSCPFSVSLHRPQDALNCAMSPANLVGQDRPGKIENNRMANKDPPRIAGGYFSFGHSPNNTSGAQVRIKRLPACAHYLLPVNGSRGSNILNWSASLSLFSWSAMYSVIAFVFFPTVST